MKNQQHEFDSLTKEEKAAVGSLQANMNIVIQRQDKGGGAVVMNRLDYNAKLLGIISDETKFIPCPADQTEIVKKEVNIIANSIKSTSPLLYHKIRRTGDFYNGHLYGLPKIHKNSADPPLRPIISMVGTVTHDIAQFINSVIRPYLNTSQIVKSGTEIIAQFENITLNTNECLVSLDVESLFTNVPVRETIDIIIEMVYSHDNLQPPKIDRDILNQLLLICTTKTPFEHNGQTFLQSDGVSMGSPLGPTFADFYMSHIENKLLAETRASNPRFYKRYVDDIIAIFHSKRHIKLFKQRLQKASVLQFTHEEMKDNSFHFLDVKLSIDHNGQFSTTVYIKPTDTGTYSNYNSHIPLTYKKSIIKTLVHRAIKYCSTWDSLHQECNRIKQIFANNHFPQAIVEQIINNAVSKHISPENNHNSQDKMHLYVRLTSIEKFKQDKKQLRSIVKQHVKPSNSDQYIDIIPYYKPTKLISSFSTRPRKDPLKTTHVVYQFDCPVDRCNSVYVGYTTCRLERRIQQHKYNSSSIHSHLQTDHPDHPPLATPQMQSSFKIVHTNNNVVDLKILEALTIREKNAYINVCLLYTSPSPRDKRQSRMPSSA